MNKDFNKLWSLASIASAIYPIDYVILNKKRKSKIVKLKHSKFRQSKYSLRSNNNNNSKTTKEKYERL